ncbi:zwei Ig domain protein zig-8-like isoform X1 [Scylla paramamosain]|uniref:zwei Ig domain protein zig-8-like isoform X1 n=1 Tax=Scylla paramamosain TaxID=85552 RepID=UPI00308340B2
MCAASPTLHLLLLLLLLPLLTPAPGVNGGGPAGRNAGDEELMNTWPLVTDQPYFDPSMSTTLTAHVGRRAELHCRVHSIGNRTVSWIRGRDLRILTVGRYTYTTDLRYEVLHQDGTNQWTLRIRSAQPRDQGTYECQISTKPVKAFTVFLKVLEPRGEILGSPDLYVQKASMINLTCILHNLPEPPAYVFWYHGNKDIRYSSGRGGVAVLVEKGPSTTTSHLLISSATLQDAGRYTCSSAGLSPTSVRVHVLDGEEPAAMQKNSSAALPSPLDGRAAMSNSSAVVSGATRTVKAEAVTLALVLVPAWLQLRGC